LIKRLKKRQATGSWTRKKKRANTISEGKNEEIEKLNFFNLFICSEYWDTRINSQVFFTQF